MHDDQKVVLITGGSSGIGKATAKRLLTSPKFAVTIAGRTVERLETALSELMPPADSFHAVQADVTNPLDVERLVSSTLRRFGRIDVLVNSAGIGAIGPFLEVDSSTMEQLWRVNVLGTMLLTQAVLPYMIEQKQGLIINLPGILGIKTIPNAALYCATKHAIIGFSNALLQEVKRHNIRITNICCSGVDTPFWDALQGRPRVELLLKPEEVAETIYQILMQPPHLITNQVLLQHAAHQI
ncbi:SDR family oxidoreductase [Chthonomonas calidirosea]|uniref:SDR family oxidoreductase n=1 Tax=Chthonomonas calidirosea TaxID=454171 RepID=UPI0006ECC02E|nr:SDR family oxidoreductase [Chthonomonas calidirosea]CEK13771.1 short-chain alcohol dehydrogenase [Chthonomonas calidirosea]